MRRIVGIFRWASGLAKLMLFISLLHANLSFAGTCFELTQADSQVRSAKQLDKESNEKWKTAFSKILQKLIGPGNARFTKPEIAILASLEIPETDLQNPVTPETKSKILSHLGAQAKLGSDLSVAIFENQKRWLSGIAALSPIRAPQPTGDSLTSDGDTPLNAAYGMYLIPPNDPAYNDPLYLVTRMRSRGLSGIGAFRDDPNNSLVVFMTDFAKLSINTDQVVVPIAITQSASDVGSLLLELAEGIVSLRHKKRVPGRILVFDGSYVAGRGSLRSLSLRERTPAHFQRSTRSDEPDFAKNVIPFRPVREEIANQSLAFHELRSLVTLEDELIKGDVGVIMIEPVMSSAYMRVHNPNFLLAVQSFAKKYGVAVVSDESMTGGGRTGLPFGFLNYQGFVPNFVVFGKGIIASGLAEVNPRNGENPFRVSALEAGINKEKELLGMRPGFQFRFFDSTVKGWPDVFEKSSIVLSKIYHENLPANAKQMGSLLQVELQWLSYIFCEDPEKKWDYFHPSRTDNDRLNLIKMVHTSTAEKVLGIGLMLSIKAGKGRIRIMPPLTITETQIDEFIRKVVIDTLRLYDKHLFGGQHSIEIAGLEKLREFEFKAAAYNIRTRLFPKIALTPIL